MGHSARRREPRLAARIADHAGEIADNQHDLVPQILKLAHFFKHNRVTQMQIWSRGIAAQFDDQLPTAGEFLFQTLERRDLHRATADDLELRLNG